MKQILLVLLVAGCAHHDFKHARMDADRTNEDSHRTFVSRFAKEQAKLGLGRFEPQFEVLDPEGNREPSEPAIPPPVHQRVMDPSGLWFVVDPGRVGYLPPQHDSCGTWSPPWVPLFTRTERGGVRIVVVKAKVKTESIHVSGSCAMSGCGTQPQPPPEMVAWLGVPDMAAVAIETVEVPYTRVEVTCDRPLYPP